MGVASHRLEERSQRRRFFPARRSARGGVGFKGSLYAMAAGVAAVLLSTVVVLPAGMGRINNRVKFTAAPEIN